MSSKGGKPEVSPLQDPPIRTRGVSNALLPGRNSAILT
jgi:hypothetical protein